MKAIVYSLSLVLFSLPASAAKKEVTKVQIPTQTEDRAFQSRGAGLAGAIAGSKTEDVVFMVNAVVNGDHARLRCFENHNGCTALGPGEYDDVLEKDSVWIISTMPVTHKEVRDHWKITGSW